MRRLLVVAVALLATVAPTAALAQGPVTWVRGYPEQSTPNCVWYVAQWSDGSFTSVPWQCAPGTTAQRGGVTASRGYPQRAANGCIEYVAQWSDGSFSSVPFSCPANVTYVRTSANVATPIVAPAAPIAPPASPVAPPAPPAPAVRFTAVVGGPPGGRASATVQTQPGATCSITYFTPAGTNSSAQGLVSQRANAAGVASWSWVIGTATRPGTGTVVVTCDGATARAPISIG